MNSRFSLVIVAGLLLLLIPVAAWADDTTTTPGMKNDPADSTTKDNMQGTMTETDLIFQSSKLADLNVFNKDQLDQKLGKVDNLIINEHTGNVMFAILDTGVMGHNIAVPWSALQLRKETVGDKNIFCYLLNKSTDDLKTAPTFDKKNISQVTDRNWMQSVQKFFGVQTVAKPEDLQGSGQLSVSQLIFESSQLSDLNVYNRNDNSMKLGNLDDLIINAHSGTVQYALLDTGLGGKHIAVPWDALLLQKEQNKDKYWLTLNKNSDDLKTAPTFDTDQIAKVSDPQWQQTVDQFFGVRMASKPKQERE